MWKNKRDTNLLFDERIAYYWTSYFNGDLSRYRKYLIDYFGTFQKWETLTLEQVNEKLRWPQSLKSLNVFCRGNMKGDLTITRKEK